MVLLQESYCGGQHLILGLMGLVLNFNHAECQYRPSRKVEGLRHFYVLTSTLMMCRLLTCAQVHLSQLL